MVLRGPVWCRAVPCGPVHLKHALASDRLKIKKGDPISVYEAVGFHRLAEELRSDPDYSDRFAYISCSAPAESTMKPCAHRLPAHWPRAAQYEAGMFSYIMNHFGKISLCNVWSFEKVVTEELTNSTGRRFDAFVICWSYYRRLVIGTESIWKSDNTLVPHLVFSLSDNLKTQMAEVPPDASCTSPQRSLAPDVG